MNPTTALYRPNLSLLTDLYQLTMAYGYWKNGMAEKEAVFHLFYRKNPFKGGYAIAAGLEHAASFLSGFGFSGEDLAYLATLTGNDGAPLFESAFLDFLRDTPFSCDIDAMPEGTLAFPHEPLIRVKGPLYQGQLIETPLLTMVNFQTLIATKAARICRAAQGDTVLEFGLRRAQGVDGGLSASRAAYVGGCHATSNVLAGRLFDIPVKGTHAHAWVMSFDSEPDAFEAYAAAMPNNCVFLVDTYDTIQGVRHAIEAGRRLREKGYEMAGIRLDSGDLAQLSIEARRMLDEAGFPNAKVVASNDLNDHIIEDLKAQGAQIAIWGVGTKLATAYDQPALGGVYKLAAIENAEGGYDYKVKLSNTPIKVSNPGILQVRRYFQAGQPVGDMLYNTEQDPESAVLHDPMDPARTYPLPVHDHFEDLLQPVFRAGKMVMELPDLHQVRQHTLEQLASAPQETVSLHDPAHYPVGLESDLFKLKMQLIEAAKA